MLSMLKTILSRLDKIEKQLTSDKQTVLSDRTPVTAAAVPHKQKIDGPSADVSHIIEQARTEAKSVILEAKHEALRIKREAEQEGRKVRQESLAIEERLAAKEENIDKRLALFEQNEAYIKSQEQQIAK